MRPLYHTRSSFICNGGLRRMFLSELDHEDCSICLRPYLSISDPSTLSDDGWVFEEPVALPCGHVFGSVCILTWTMDSMTCPYCRTRLFERFDENKGSETDVSSEYCEEWDFDFDFDPGLQTLSYDWQAYVGATDRFASSRVSYFEELRREAGMEMAPEPPYVHYADDADDVPSRPASRSIWWNDADDAVFEYWESGDTANHGYSIGPHFAERFSVDDYYGIQTGEDPITGEDLIDIDLTDTENVGMTEAQQQLVSRHRPQLKRDGTEVSFSEFVNSHRNWMAEFIQDAESVGLRI